MQSFSRHQQQTLCKWEAIRCKRARSFNLSLPPSLHKWHFLSTLYDMFRGTRQSWGSFDARNNNRDSVRIHSHMQGGGPSNHMSISTATAFIRGMQRLRHDSLQRLYLLHSLMSNEQLFCTLLTSYLSIKAPKPTICSGYIFNFHHRCWKT